MQILKMTKDEGSIIVGYKCDNDGCERQASGDSLPNTWTATVDGDFCKNCWEERGEEDV